MSDLNAPASTDAVPAFLDRVIRTSVLLLVLGALLLLNRRAYAASISLAFGGLANLLMLRSARRDVERIFSPGQRDLRLLHRYLLSRQGYLVLFVLVSVVLTLAGRLNPLWLFAGFLTPHLVMILKGAGLLLTQADPATGRAIPAPRRGTRENDRTARAVARTKERSE